MDVDSIDLGVDFLAVINRALSRCSVLIVVIGQRWLEAVDQDGGARLHNPNDYVRLEIETALKRNIRVVPILVDDAKIPRGDELPRTMESLTRRNGISISHRSFDSDVERLLQRLAQLRNTS